MCGTCFFPLNSTSSFPPEAGVTERAGRGRARPPVPRLNRRAALTSAGGGIPQQRRGPAPPASAHRALSCAEAGEGLAGSQATELSILQCTSFLLRGFA